MKLDCCRLQRNASLTTTDYQDNDPKHSSKYIKHFLENKGVNWWYTPPELNPVELVWGSLKQYLAKPKNPQELKEGIKEFWHTLTPEVCRKYIGHVKKVIPKIIQEEGGPSGY